LEELFTGIVGGMWLLEPIDRDPRGYEKAVQRLGWITLLGYIVIGVACFYAFRNPQIQTV